MAGKTALLIAAGALFLCVPAFSQSPIPPSKPPGEDGGPPKHRDWKRDGDGKPEPDNSPAMENVRKAIEALTPEQKKRFAENVWRWSQMPEEEKAKLRDRDDMRKRFMDQEYEAALKDSGLALEGERLEGFKKRYAEERRKIEEQLRKEMGEKRKPLLQELIGRLRLEFAAPAPAKQ